MKALILSFMLVMVSYSLNAQSLEFGIGLGALNYSGDMDTPSFSDNITNTGFGLQLNARYYLNHFIAIRGNVIYGKVKGDDRKSSAEWQLERNLRFSSSYFEGAILGELYFLNFSENSASSKLKPYLIGGFSFFKFNPMTDYRGVNYELQPLGTEGQGLPGFAERYSLTSTALLFGGGIKLMINEKSSLNFELVAHRTNTDYLDDLSGDYVAYTEILEHPELYQNPQLAASLSTRKGEYFGQGYDDLVFVPTGTTRGNERVNDYVISFMISFNTSLSSDFGRRSKSAYNGQCPTF